ncbi:MAG: polysaccharide biosynthesis protein [Cytophagaceae bacterium]|jgi:FlaA1/EpsC-like NDP-sugar epimerase|nr:polysaccharide biosynthesis protein [Cytophagaceae bacterium]
MVNYIKDFLLRIFGKRIISPWLILTIDLFLLMISFGLAYILRLNFTLTSYPVADFFVGIVEVTLVYGIIFFLFGVHRGVIRHTSFTELRRLLSACIAAFIILLIIDIAIRTVSNSITMVPRLVLILHFMQVVLLCFGFRLFVREVYTYLTRNKGTINAVIYGAGDLGMITFEAIENDKDNQYNVVGFVDDDSSKWNKNLHSLPVFKWSKLLTGSSKTNDLQEVILAMPSVSVKRKQEIAEECLRRNWKLKVMPSVVNWMNGISNMGQIRDVRIEDLLGRDEIKLNQKRILNGLENKIILVSGAAGSIGSEIVRQLLRFPVKKLILLDQAESALYDLQQEILLKYYDAPFELVLADVTNPARTRNLFETYHPEIVFNAAAYKHVPMMEDNPYEAVRVNIGGTKNLADLSVEFGVEKFIMVSTDKAVNPTNVMGTSKRICEIYVQSLSQTPNIKTGFVTTRFGNVLGSNGSVVPLFKRQISEGGPVTVTHPDITRYFMTIPEACQLLLEAAFMGECGEIFVFDMGEPVKIYDLAKKMIQLSGLMEGIDIDIKFTGLRPGEKLYEELLASKENTKPTYNDKIMIGNVRLYDFAYVNAQVKDMLAALQTESDASIVTRMHKMVPEFIPQNERYRKLVLSSEIVV